MIKKMTACFVAIAATTSLAIADESHKHAEGDGHVHAQDETPKHGGVVQHSGHHHLELVAKGGTVELYVSADEGEAEDTSAAKASATVLADGKVEKVELAPSGGNGLKGTGSFNAGKGTTIVVLLTMPGHEPEQVRFKID